MQPDTDAAPLRVLVVDDEPNIRTTLGISLESLGCAVSNAATADEALAALRGHPQDLILLDLRLGEEDGLELLPRLSAESPGVSVVVITAYATFDTAVEAVKRGAQDYLPKPFTPDQIRQVVERVAANRRLMFQNWDLEERLRRALPEALLQTGSMRMKAVLEMATKAALSNAPVLLRGESGTGKEVLARTVHAGSDRVAHPFMVVNCPTLSKELLASELFGHVRGAFTGALRDRIGRVEAAHRGTLFLDEIGEMPPSIQAKLLRFLQDRQFERLGENTARSADVRLVAATNRSLEKDMIDGLFREDLYYRLSVVEIELPPLRDRPEDILPLARHFLEFFAQALNRPPARFSPQAETLLCRYPWPGNIRELRNAVERAMVLAAGSVLEPGDFPGRLAQAVASGPRLGGDFKLEEIENEHIKRVVARAPSLQKAANILGVDTSTLWRRRKREEG